MSELNLLTFGCLVSFIAAGGAYVYVRECFTEAREHRRTFRRRSDTERKRMRDAA